MKASSPQLQIHSTLSRAQHFTGSAPSLGKVFKGKTQTHKEPFMDCSLGLLSRPVTTNFGSRPISRDIMPQRAATSHKSMRKKHFQEQTDRNEFPLDELKNQALNIMQRQQSTHQQVYYANTQYRNLLHQNKFHKQLASLKPEDRKCPLILSMLKKHFSEIEINDYNILICQHLATEEFFVYFSDSEWMPFSKCCEVPIYVRINVKHQKIMMHCNQCDIELADQFSDRFTLFQKTSQGRFFNNLDEVGINTRHQREQIRISKLVITGKFRHLNMKKNYKFNELQLVKHRISQGLEIRKQNQIASDRNCYSDHLKPGMKQQETAYQNESTLNEIRNIINEWIE